MEKTVKVTIDIKHARTMIHLAGFWETAESGTDDEVFATVLDMMTCYGAKTEIIEEQTASNAPDTFCEFDKYLCNNGVAF